MNEDDRKVEEERFVNENVNNTLKWLLLRAHLPPKIAKEVRIFEIASNEGLGLKNSKLINYVRQLEMSKEEDKETINKVDDWKSGRCSPDRQNKYEKLSTKEFLERRDKLLDGCCAQCGKKNLTDSHPSKSCRAHVKCDECGKRSHLTKFCVRKDKKNEGRVYAMEYEGPSDDSDNEEDSAKINR